MVLQAQQDTLNKQHQLEKENAKVEVLELRQRLEEVTKFGHTLRVYSRDGSV